MERKVCSYEMSSFVPYCNLPNNCVDQLFVPTNLWHYKQMWSILCDQRSDSYTLLKAVYCWLLSTDSCVSVSNRCISDRNAVVLDLRMKWYSLIWWRENYLPELIEKISTIWSLKITLIWSAILWDKQKRFLKRVHYCYFTHHWRMHDHNKNEVQSVLSICIRSN